eukprot:1572338-Prymnesium_polylepis.1
MPGAAGKKHVSCTHGGGTIMRVPAARRCLPKSLTTPDCPAVFVRLAAYGPRSQSLPPGV